MECLLCFLAGALPSLERPAELKVMGTGNKTSLRGSLELRVSVTFPFLTFDSWTHGSWLWEKLYHILDVDSKHIPPSGKPWPQLPDCCLLIGQHMYFQMAIPSVCQGSGFRMVGNMVRLVDSMTMDPPSHFSDCQMSSLVRSNTVWNIIMVDKTFYKSMYDGFGRSICAGQANS